MTGPYTPRPIFFSPTLRETLSKPFAKQGYIDAKIPARQHANCTLERKSRSYGPIRAQSSQGPPGGKWKTAHFGAQNHYGFVRKLGFVELDFQLDYTLFSAVLSTLLRPKR